MRRQDRMSSLFFLIASIGICVHACQLNIGTPSRPAQGFLPFVSGACIGLVSLWTLLAPFIHKRIEQNEEVKKFSLKKVFPVMGVLVCYSLLLPFLGFVTTTFLLFIFFFRIMARMVWWKVLLGSAAVSVASFLFFVRWLQCQLPPGILGY
jgi:putative tricarboxylic transport membrane protein